jgi:hypothetical protein
MQLIPYAGYEPPNRKKKARPPKARKMQPSRARVDFVLPYQPTLFTPEQRFKVPPMPDSLKALMFDVCLTFRITPNDLVGPGRAKELVNARKAFVRRARDELGASFPRIGDAIRRDHTTAVYNYYGRRRIRESVIAS